MWLRSIGVFISVYIVAVRSANILCLSFVPTYSHYIVPYTLYRELAIRGHNITFISPIKKDVTEKMSFILIEYDKNVLNDYRMQLYDFSQSNVLKQSKVLEEIFLYFTNQLLSNAKVQELIKSKTKFDMVIIPQHQSEALKGFCHHFQAACVLVSPTAASRWSNPYMSNSGPPSYVPELLTNFQSEMGLLQRFYNSIVYFLTRMQTYCVTYPKHELLLKKYFPNPPSLYDIMYNASLMLVNSHYSIHNAVPYGPNMVEVGGLHVKPPKPLPHDLQDFLNHATHGAIYFSLGSSITLESISKHTQASILNVFAKLKQRVLWKWDGNDTMGLKNVKMQKWLPQNDVLAHPNVKVFISQGGQMSMTEAVYHGVPVLGMPIWVDQHTNVMHAVKLGYALSVTINNFSEEKFEKALHELLYNTSYHKNMKKRSLIFHDRPMKPLDSAVFWVEHIIKHGGGSHLKTAASNLTLYQYFLIDVIIMLILTLILVVAAIIALIRVLSRKIGKSSCDSKKNK